MSDEELQKEKYRCDFNGIGSITVRDLLIKAKNSVYVRPVTLNRGEYILTELLDFADLKKSRTSGALKQLIQMGYIAVENSAVPNETIARETVMAPASKSSVITELQAGTVSPNDITNLISGKDSPESSAPNVLDYPEDKQPKVYELISDEQSRTPNTFAISEVDASNTFEKFNSLRYFQKLKAIREMTDVRLLETITTKSSYPQLIHNSKTRLKEIQNGK